MAWRGSTDFKDRFFAAIVYMIPLVYAMPFGQFLFAQFPFLTLLQIPLIPITVVYSSIPFAGLIVFFILFAAVVRNERINHFIRFNTMQAILINIILFLCSIVLGLLARGLGSTNLLAQTLYNVIFIGSLAACLYSIVQSILGRYAEIPTISDAAYSQVR
ncbi:hypothetical protein IQ238_22505 [Pleurocapsales cyanobacterium LEGE 06147]|nr:hypothetical protein [Pleurocapsales cyanobacterium LEGE 06147]